MKRHLFVALIFGQTPMNIGVKNEKRIPKEGTPLVAPTASERNHKVAPAKLAYVTITFCALVGIVAYTHTPKVKDPARNNTTSGEATYLKNVVEEALEGATGTYGIVIQNLKTGETYYANEHRAFDAASLYKLWVMAVVYNQIQNGQLQKDQVLSQDAATLNAKFSMDPAYAEPTEGAVTFTIQDALDQMITISHNYAALLLMEKVKLSSVAAFLKDKGFIESAVGTDEGYSTATPYDIALFFEKLYKSELANNQYTSEMIDLLKGQQRSGGLPKYLPEGTIVAHKTGELGLYKHDAGIVFSDKGDYIIVVMSESEFPLSAQEKIALVSKGVFDYLYGKLP